jgi:multidrug efflux system membrane fusion protein
MRYRRQTLLILASALLPFASGCEKPAPRAEPPPPKVTVAHPEVRELTDYDNYNGWIDAVDTVEVRARVRGHIQKIHFTDGQLVKKGDLLFELDPRTFESDIGRAKDQKAIAQAQLVAAQKEYARLKELLTRGGASQSQVDKAEADATALEATVKAEDQEIVRRQLELEYSKITAPLAGRIGRAMLSEGNLVNAGGSDPLLATIVSTDPIYIYFPVDERALQRYQKQRVREGQKNRPSTLKESQIKIRFGLETDEGYPYEAVLDFADNTVDRTTGTIVARAVMPDPTGRLTPGSRVRIRVPTSGEHNVVLIADTAILTDQDKKYVLLLDDKNVVQRFDVNPGKLLDDGMRVTMPNASGKEMTAKDWIVVQGLQMARINYPVDPVKPAATTQPTQSASLGH